MQRQLTICSVAIGLVLCSTLPAHADVSLLIQDGRVTLVARNAPLKEVLAAWARVGKVQVIGADALLEVVNLELRNVPEATALRTVLRSVPGYVVVPRQAAPTASQFDRIHILAANSGSGILADLPLASADAMPIAVEALSTPEEPATETPAAPPSAALLATLTADALASLAAPRSAEEMEEIQRVLESLTQTPSETAP